jgi:hypothetical protein
LRRGTVFLLTVLILDGILDHELAGGSLAYADTRIIPSVTVSERYDTNVFNTATQFIPPDRKKWDFVTTAAPQVRFISSEEGIKTDLLVGASGNTFVNNPELSFISTNAALTSNLDKFIGTWIPGAKLEVSDYFRYTPQPPAFLTGVQTSEGVPDIYSRGLQVARANATSNTARVTGTYALSPTVDLLGTYSHSFFSIGRVFVSQGTGGATPTSGLTTETHAWAVGPSLQLSRGDTVSLQYKNAETRFSGRGTSGQSFTARGVEAEYSGTIEDWTVKFAGGGALVEPGNRTYPTGRIVLTTRLDPATTAMITLSRTIAPTLFGTIGALVSNTAGVSLEHSLERGVLLTGAINYATNESTPVKSTKFETIAGQLMLTYPLSRTIATTMRYDYSHFTFNSSVGGITRDFLVDKSVLTLSVVFTW